METRFLIGISTILMLSAACQHAELEEFTNDGPRNNVYTAVIEQEEVPASAEVRSTATDEGRFFWVSGDEISIVATDGSYKVYNTSLAVSEDGRMGTFSLPGTYSVPTWATYPCVIGNGDFDSSGSLTKLTLPEGCGSKDKAYSASTNAIMLADVTAHSADAPVVFKHLGGVFKLTVKGVPAGADRFVLTAPGKAVSGEFTIWEGADGYKYIATSNLAEGAKNNSYTITFAPLESAQDMTFYIPLPVGTYDKGFVIDMYNGNAHIFTKTSTVSREINRKSLAIASASGTFCGGISTAEDLAAFAAAVNAGESTETWQDLEGVVNQLADIDMADKSADWTPIGNAVVSPDSNLSEVSVTGNPFSGIFDGNGYKITNLNMTFTGTTDYSCFGLFGVVKNGEVRNVQVGTETAAGDSGSGCSLNVNTSVKVWAGVIAAGVIDSRIADCTSYAAINYDSQSTAAGNAYVGMIGLCFADAQENYVNNLRNYGDISVVSHGCIINNINAVHAGGIAGICSSNGTNLLINNIEYCTNYGDITADNARSSGIVAAANSCTAFNSCFNYGNQENSMGSGKGRLGMITCITGQKTTMVECVNYGDLISTAEQGARVGGIVSLVNHSTNTFTDCANYGKIISNDTNRGAFWGYSNQTVSWTNCTASGSLGTYNGGSYVLDNYEDNKVKYLGALGKNTPTLTNITYNMDGGEAPEVDKDENATLRILCIGNSFTKDAVEHLPGMIDAAGIKTVRIVHMYYGGRTIPEYNNGYETSSDYRCYTKRSDASSWSEETEKNLQAVVNSEEWDIVTIQEHTGNYRAWSWTEEEKAAVQGLVDKIKADQGTNVPKFKYIMSQAYYNMDKIGSGSKPYMTFTTQDEMFDVIVAQAKKVKEDIKEIDEIIPTGTVLQNLRHSSLNVNNGMDLTRDGYHMDYGISRYAAACAVFEMLISPGTGIKLDENTYRYSNSSTSATGYSTPVTDANYKIALKAARYAVANPFETTPVSQEGKGIGSAADLKAFADAVNAGNTLDAWTEAGEIVLLNDIDMKDVMDITPVGTSGKPFSGKFNGHGFKIYNINVKKDISGLSGYALFGHTKGASIKNLIVGAEGDRIELTGKAENFFAGGIVAVAENTTIAGCTNNLDIHLSGDNTFNKLASLAGIAGRGISSVIGSTDLPCVNNGDMTTGNISNTKNGGTGMQVAGICGIVDNVAGMVITNCTNNGHIAAPAGRGGGIVGTFNNGQMTDCTNAGLIEDDVNGQYAGVDGGYDYKRMGGLSGSTGTDAVLENCISKGTVITHLTCRTGGFVGHNTGKITGCEHRGTVIGDVIQVGTVYHGAGWACGYNKKDLVTGCFGFGRTGDYEFKDRLAEAPFDSHNRAVVHTKSTYDPELNEVDWSKTSYYDWEKKSEKKLHDGLLYTYYEFTNLPRKMHVLELDLTNPNLEITTSLSDDLVPNPNGNNNSNNGKNIRETLSENIARKRAEGQNIIAGFNSGFFDSNDGYPRGIHIENGRADFVNNLDVRQQQVNHRNAFTVFKDNTVSCGVKEFSGKIQWGGKEIEYYSINDIILRNGDAVQLANVYTDKYRETPHSGFTNPLAKKAFYIVAENTSKDGKGLQVNADWIEAKILSVHDGRTTALSKAPYVTSSDRWVVQLTGQSAEDLAGAKKGDSIKIRVDVKVDGVAKPILTQNSSMYQFIKDGVSSTQGAVGKYDPMTYVGVNQAGTKAYFIVIDGRQPWVSMGVKFYEMIKIAEKFGCWNMTRFDGGGSTTLWINDGTSGKVVNTPSDSNGERSCMNYMHIRVK